MIGFVYSILSEGKNNESAEENTLYCRKYDSSNCDRTPAVILERDGGYRQTTTVLNMKKLSDSVIRFETQNTRYLLHVTSDAKAVTV